LLTLLTLFGWTLGRADFHPLLVSRTVDGATRSSDQSYEVMINLVQTRPQN
jgi:hypothetical protein